MPWLIDTPNKKNKKSSKVVFVFKAIFIATTAVFIMMPAFDFRGKFANELQLLISRVSAATFDSDIVPASSLAWKIGAIGQTWTSINELVYFNGINNVGIGIIDPKQRLEIDGGVRLYTVLPQPPCEAVNSRGTLWFVQGGAGVADALYVCVKQSNNTYAWKSLL